ncbi:MAG TPA: hypothetical protein VGG48_10020 [Rhizomicrobium sp.]|jgi:hypothetical protein
MMGQRKTPPRARIAFRIGVVGHRPNRLPQDDATLDTLRGVIHDILDTAKSAVFAFRGGDADAVYYSDETPLLRAVSPLAEGSDRMFADEALDLGYALTCPMPFAQARYEEDFAPENALEPNSIDRFHRLLERARTGAGLTVFELDGARGPKKDAAAEAYGAAGRVVLNQSDLLIVVWDGKGAEGGGGTVQTLEEALKYNVPVLWIGAHDPSLWQHLQGKTDGFFPKVTPPAVPSDTLPPEPQARRDAIAGIVGSIVHDTLALPAQEEPDDTEAEKPLTPADYFAEVQPWFNVAFVWKLFRNLVGRFQLRFPEFLVPRFVADSGDWPVAGDKTVQAPRPFVSWVNARLRDHYAWADGLADFYADRYRSAYILSYLFAAIAVLVALLPGVMGWKDERETICIAVELALLSSILLSLWRGRRRQWHNRWMEYRLLAEMVRQLRFLVPLGGGTPTPHLPAHLAAFGKPTHTWMYWHVCAIARAAGIPQAKVAPDYVMGCLDYLGDVVGTKKTGQWAFHLNTEKTSVNIHKRLHSFSLLLFGATIVCIFFHLFIQLANVPGMTVHWNAWFQNVPHQLLPYCDWLVLLCATLPAFGAALAGINNQGEFARLAKRSAGMASDFAGFNSRIDVIRERAQKGSDPKLADVLPLATEIAGMMVEEVMDWRVLFVDRPQTA